MADGKPFFSVSILQHIMKHNNNITQRKMPNVLPEGMNHEEVRILR